MSQGSPAGGRRCFLTKWFFYPPQVPVHFRKLPCGFLTQGLVVVLGLRPKDAENPFREVEAGVFLLLLSMLSPGPVRQAQ